MFNISMSAEELRTFLVRHQIKELEFSRIIGVTKPAVDHWLSGRRRIPDTYVKLMKTFDKYPGLLREFGA